MAELKAPVVVLYVFFMLELNSSSYLKKVEDQKSDST